MNKGWVTEAFQCIYFSKQFSTFCLLIIQAKYHMAFQTVFFCFFFFSLLATTVGLIQGSKSKTLLCSWPCTCSLPIAFPSERGNVTSAWLWHQVQEEKSTYSFSGNLFRADWTSWAKKCYERCFSHLKRVNKASCSQILRLEAETQSIVEWGLVGAAIFRPSAYFGIAFSEKNRLRALTRCYRLPRSTLPCQ